MIPREVIGDLWTKAEVCSGSFASDIAEVLGWLTSDLPRNDNRPEISPVPRIQRRTKSAFTRVFDSEDVVLLIRGLPPCLTQMSSG